MCVTLLYFLNSKMIFLIRFSISLMSALRGCGIGAVKYYIQVLLFTLIGTMISEIRRVCVHLAVKEILRSSLYPPFAKTRSNLCKNKERNIPHFLCLSHVYYQVLSPW